MSSASGHHNEANVRRGLDTLFHAALCPTTVDVIESSTDLVPVLLLLACSSGGKSCPELDVIVANEIPYTSCAATALDGGVGSRDGKL
jgi:hypothetical protein